MQLQFNTLVVKEDFLKKLEKSEEDYKEGRIYSAEEVFKELRKEFKY